MKIREESGTCRKGIARQKRGVHFLVQVTLCHAGVEAVSIAEFAVRKAKLKPMIRSSVLSRPLSVEKKKANVHRRVVQKITPAAGSPSSLARQEK